MHSIVPSIQLRIPCLTPLQRNPKISRTAMKFLEYPNGYSSDRDKQGAKRKPLIIHLALKPCSGTPRCILTPKLPTSFYPLPPKPAPILIQPRYYRILLIIGVLPLGFIWTSKPRAVDSFYCHLRMSEMCHWPEGIQRI